jgi:hypothetical protein
MAYRVPSTAIRPDLVDAWMGRGSHYDWMNTVAEIREQFGLLESTLRLLPVEWAKLLAMQTTSDAFLLEKVAHDYGWGLAQVAQANAPRRIEKRQLAELYEIQSDLLETLKLEVGSLQAVVVAGGLSTFLIGQFNNVQRAAVEAQRKIDALKVALNDAKNKRLQSVGQGVLDTGLFIVGLAFPEIPVLGKIAIAVGQWAADELLGGSKGSADLDRASDVGTKSSVVTAAADPRWIDDRLGKPAGKANTALGAAGLVFDGAEIRTQFKNVDAVSTALNEAVASLSTVRKLLVRLAPGLSKLRVQMNATARSIRESMVEADDFRDDAMELIRAAKYPMSSPIIWRLEK